MILFPFTAKITCRLALVLMALANGLAAQNSASSWIQLTPSVSWYQVTFAGVERDMRTAAFDQPESAVPFSGFGRGVSYGLVVTFPVRERIRIGCAIQFFPTEGSGQLTRQDSLTTAIFDNRYLADVYLFQIVLDVPQVMSLGDGSLGLRMAAGPAYISFRKEFDVVVTTTAPPFPGTFGAILQGDYKATTAQAELVFTVRCPVVSAVSIVGHCGWTTTRTKSARGTFNLDPIFSEEARAQSPFMHDVEFGFHGFYGGAGIELRL
jgi:hypothetical protein